MKFLQTKKLSLRLKYLYLKVFFSVVDSYTHFDFFDLRKTKPSIHYSYVTKCNYSTYFWCITICDRKETFPWKKISNSHHSKIQKYKLGKICVKVFNLFVRLLIEMVRVTIPYYRRACEHGDWSFDSHINPILTRGHILPTLYWCPHQVLKVTGGWY